MRLNAARSALVILAGLAGLSCTDSAGHDSTLTSPRQPSLDAAPAPVVKVVISQVYGGGGNAGSVYKNDFIELYNAGNVAVDLTGWSVQYGSATGSTWSGKTALAGSIAVGGYYLVQESAGSGGTTALPTPNAVGTISMASGAGKVALVNGGTTLTGACPLTDASVVDLVGYGTGTSGANCFEGSAAAPTISNTTAELRKNNGATDTDNNAADFATGAPNPRNGPAGGPVTAGPLDHVNIGGGSTVAVNGTLSLTATMQDAGGQNITDPAATFAWQSADPTIASIQSTAANGAVVLGAHAGGPVAITVTATSNGITRTGTLQLTVTAAVAGHITIGSGTTPLVIGYQSGFFVASGSTDRSGNPVTSAGVTWSTSDPSIVTIDSRGVATAVSSGSATITGTSSDGSSDTFVLPTEVPIYSTTARTGHNTEFGIPRDNDPSNDVIVAREQYTISYNPQRGGPNWVSWDLSATHLGTRNRCNCYSADTALARLGYGQYMYTTADYTGGGYDRGHMEPSADQTTTDGENARTFFLTNFLPQAHGLNAGPWEALENALRDSVNAGREAYIIAGGIFANGVGLGSLKNEGKIFIPNSTWKIAVLMPANTGIGNVTSATDIDVIAVNMPNVDSPGTNDWTTFKTTVQNIQQATGYDFLSALPESIQCRVEVRNCAPSAHITGAGLAGGNEGQTLTFDASTSSDPDAGTTLSYMWTIDGATVGIQPTLTHTFADNGTFAVRLIVSDQLGAADTTLKMVTLLNVAPSVNAFAGATISKGTAYTAAGSFTDPGDDNWAATVDYGDGSGVQALALSGKTFALNHVYATPGTYTVKVTVTETDPEAASGTQTATVTAINVRPVVTSFAGATLLRGESYTQGGTFTDSDPDSWTATVNYGDGSGTQSLTLLGKSFGLLHPYLAVGTFTVTVRVNDGFDTGTGSATVVVETAAQGVDDLSAQIAALGGLNKGQLNSLQVKLDQAGGKLAAGDVNTAVNQLGAFINEINADVQSGRISASAGASIVAYATRVIASMNVP